jgi:hypothetical protein
MYSITMNRGSRVSDASPRLSILSLFPFEVPADSGRVLTDT